MGFHYFWKTYAIMLPYDLKLFNLESNHGLSPQTADVTVSSLPATYYVAQNLRSHGPMGPHDPSNFKFCGAVRQLIKFQVHVNWQIHDATIICM